MSAALRYNDSKIQSNVQNFVAGAVEPGLAFIFVLYSLYIYSHTVEAMYKYFVYVLGIGAIVFTFFDEPVDDPDANRGWPAVAHYVASPLAAAAMFAIPIVYFS